MRFGKPSGDKGFTPGGQGRPGWRCGNFCAA